MAGGGRGEVEILIFFVFGLVCQLSAHKIFFVYLAYGFHMTSSKFETNPKNWCLILSSTSDFKNSKNVFLIILINVFFFLMWGYVKNIEIFGNYLSFLKLFGFFVRNINHWTLFMFSFSAGTCEKYRKIMNIHYISTKLVPVNTFRFNRIVCTCIEHLYTII